jgi:methionyl-tRNA synthetase
LILKPTTHWFLLLDRFEKRLTDWLEKKDWKPNVVKFIKGYIEHLHPRAITRDSNWGVPIPLPNTQGKVLYVWFDAPIGYISATIDWANRQGDPELWKKYWLDPQTKLVNFIGKDNITFHAAIFPAMVMGQNLPIKLVDELPANEFYLLEGRQFSKSDGWYVDLKDFLTRYSVDQIRYTIAANAPETKDSEFTWKDFQMRCNSELLGKFGNFIHRTLVFAKNHCRGVVPPSTLQEVDHQFVTQIHEHLEMAYDAFDHFRLRRASQILIELAALGNSYFDSKKPWTEAKSESSIPSMQTTIACSLECIKALALIAAPIIPDASHKVWKMLNLLPVIEGMHWKEIAAYQIPAGHLLGEAEILFRKIEDQQIEDELKKLNVK